MAKRKRDIQLKFRVTPQEREMIETKMAQFGTTNMAAYLRKMAIDGYVVKLDLPELRALVSLLRYSSNNLNQFTRRPRPHKSKSPDAKQHRSFYGSGLFLSNSGEAKKLLRSISNP